MIKTLEYEDDTLCLLCQNVDCERSIDGPCEACGNDQLVFICEVDYAGWLPTWIFCECVQKLGS